MEQFVQSIFPSQDPKVLNAVAKANNQGQIVPSEDPAKAAAAAEERHDLYIVMAIVMGSLFTLTSIMVKLPLHNSLSFLR